MTLTLSAKPATTLLISNRGSVRRVSGFVLVGYTEVCQKLGAKGRQSSRYPVTGSERQFRATS
jgi:hypothetical protein